MFTSGLVFWHWLVLAMLLLLLELFAPAAFFVWIGAAAAVLGLVLMLIPALGWQVQLIAFAVLSIVSVIVGRRVFRKVDTSEPTTLNRRGDQYIGREFVLDDAMENGTGRVRVDDTSWRVIGPDLPAGAKVVVKSIDGSSLVVDAV
ncbi:MAG: NfeD family protein [Pseudomonadales bacterium]